MIKSNIFLSALGLLAILILPIYPNSGTLDFGGNVDASIVYLLTLFITGISRSKIFLGIIILLFYYSMTGTYGYLELSIKFVSFYFFIFFIQKFFWENLQNDSLLILIFLILFYSISFIVYSLMFSIGLMDFLSFVCLPFIYNLFVSLILLIIIKYNSWPKVKDQVYQF